MVPNTPPGQGSQLKRPRRHPYPHHPQAQPLPTSHGLLPVAQTTTTPSQSTPQQHFTTCGSYYGGRFLSPIGTSSSREPCLCSLDKPHICCRSLSQYLTPSDLQPLPQQPYCKTRAFILEANVEFKLEGDIPQLPLPTQKLFPANKTGTAATTEETLNGGNEPAADDMVDIDLGDPLDDFISREYDTLAEFPAKDEQDNDDDSDDNFDVPSSNEDDEAPEETATTRSTLETFWAVIPNLPRTVKEFERRSRNWFA